MFGVGTILAGKYRIERMIGEGGMGMVVAATHLHLGTQVALKFLHADMAQNQHMAERFMREARASALLKSEHVCRVSDVGMLDNNAPYIVMELLTGQDLSSLLKNHGPMPISTAAEYLLQALAAIAEAHAANIVHRDLKPGNLFWTQRPDGSTLIKVLDFGIAKAPGSVNFSLTQTSSVMGSPGYMSPEQLKSSKEVDARSDIWSIGIVLYELVSNRTPFAGESITELAIRVSTDPTPPLPGHYPPAFQAVIARCLEKDPARRYQDVAELAAALAPFAGPRGVDLANGVTRVLRGHNAVPVMPAPVGGVGTSPPRPSTPTTLGAATGSLIPPPSRGRGVVIGGIAALAIVGGVIGVVLASQGGGSTNAAKETPTTPAKTDPPAPPSPTPDNADKAAADVKAATDKAAADKAAAEKAAAEAVEKANAEKAAAEKTAKAATDKAAAEKAAAEKAASEQTEKDKAMAEKAAAEAKALADAKKAHKSSTTKKTTKTVKDVGDSRD